MQLPPLPSYGADPYLGKAPVVPGQQASAQQPYATVPTTTQIPVQAGAPNAAPSAAPVPDLTPAPKKTRRHAKDKASSGGQGNDESAATGLGSEPDFDSGSGSEQSSGGSGSDGHTTRLATGQTADAVLCAVSAGLGRFACSAGNAALCAGQPVSSGAGTPGQGSANNQQFVPANNVPQTQAQGPTPQHYDIQTGLRLSDLPEDSAGMQPAPALPLPDRTIVQPSAMIQVEAPIRPLENARISLPSNPLPTPPVAVAAVANQPASLEPVQYTPSAQDAATGAYSAKPKPTQSAQQPTSQPVQQPVTTEQTTPAAKPAKKRAKKSAQQPATQTVPTLVTAPGQEQQQTPPPVETQEATVPAASDQELQQQNLPPLRGPWVRVQRQASCDEPS